MKKPTSKLSIRHQQISKISAPDMVYCDIEQYIDREFDEGDNEEEEYCEDEMSPDRMQFKSRSDVVREMQEADIKEILVAVYKLIGMRVIKVNVDEEDVNNGR